MLSIAMHAGCKAVLTSSKMCHAPSFCHLTLVGGSVQTINDSRNCQHKQGFRDKQREHDIFEKSRSGPKVAKSNFCRE